MELTADEARRAYGLGSLRRRPIGFSLLGLLLAGVLLASAEPWRPDANPATNGLVLLFAAGVMAMGFVPLLPAQWRRTFVRRRDPEAVQHVVEVAPDHLSVVRDGIERRFGWAMVSGLHVMAPFVVIDLPDRRVVLPDRAFSSRDERNRCLAAMRRSRRQATRRARVLRHRRASDPFAPPRGSGR